jgi:tRNA/rRNA methyltransferase
MGFKHLRLIDPCDHLSDQARMMAHGSNEILEAAEIFEDFDRATAGLDLVICTTARKRSAKHDYHSSREILALLQKKEKQLQNVGVLFGTEESGLPNNLVLRSDLAMSIPVKPAYPSLNLAQAVMITAYELSPLNSPGKPGSAEQKSGEGAGELMIRTRQLLSDLDIPEGSPLFHRIMERMATAGEIDIPLFLSVIGRINKPG